MTQSNIIQRLVVCIIISLTAVCVWSQSSTFTYQGYLRQAGTPANGSFNMVFRLCSTPSVGGVLQSFPAAGTVAVNVANGLFTQEMSFDTAHFSGADRWLEIVVNGTLLTPRIKLNTTPYSIFADRAPWSGLTGIPAGFADGIDNDTTYSAGAGLSLTGTTFSVATAGILTSMLADSSVTTLKVADGSITTAKLADGSVTTAKMADNSVTSAKIADGTIGTADLANGAVTDLKLSGTGVTAGTYGSATQVGVFTVNALGRITSASNATISGVSPGGAAGGDLSGTYPNPTVAGLQTRPVSSTAPTSGQVLKWTGTRWEPSADNDTTYSAGEGLALTGTTFSIPTGGVVTSMLADLAATTLKIADGAVTSLKIADGTIATTDIADGAVTSVKLSNTGVAAGTYGSATQVGRFTVDAQGRITSASNLTISGVAPGGSAGGDLSGTYPNPVVASNAITNSKLASDALSLNKVSGGRMTSTGTRVGIGISTPDSDLHVHRASAGTVSAHANAVLAVENSTNAYINLLTPAANESGILFGNTTSNVAGGIVYNSSGNPNGLQFRTNGNSTKMVITGTGQVGIGTITPSAKLQVEAATGEAILSLRSSATTRVIVSNEGRVGIGVGSGLPAAQLIVDGAFGVDPFRVRTEDSGGAATTRLIVTSGGNVGIGTTAPDQLLTVNGIAKVDVLQIAGADLAEKFPMSEEAKPGMVVMIDPAQPGKLCVAKGAYNRKVIGIVSGANEFPAGAVLGHYLGNESGVPIAMTGRVWVLADATRRAIEPGDMLTTAERSGYAMSVRDYRKAQGAVIGKAMTGLKKGEVGMVLVVVNLQ